MSKCLCGCSLPTKLPVDSPDSLEVKSHLVWSREICLLKSSPVFSAQGFTFFISPLLSPSHFSFRLSCLFKNIHSKCSELEEELKNVTNNLKSLEAQAEKVGLPCKGPEACRHSCMGLLAKEHPVRWERSLVCSTCNGLCMRLSPWELQTWACQWFEVQS